VDLEFLSFYICATVFGEYIPTAKFGMISACWDIERK
jgi:hypothetical protein